MLCLTEFNLGSTEKIPQKPFGRKKTFEVPVIFCVLCSLRGQQRGQGLFVLGLQLTGPGRVCDLLQLGLLLLPPLLLLMVILLLGPRTEFIQESYADCPAAGGAGGC